MRGSFSSVSTATIMRKDACCSIFRDLQDLYSFAQLRFQFAALPKETPRLMRNFAQSRVVGGTERESLSHVPGMSQYSDDIDMDNAGTAEYPGSQSFSTCAASQKKITEEFDIFSDGFEESIDISE